MARHTDRMERLVKDLFRLACLDAGQEALDVIVREVRSLVTGCSLTSRRWPTRAIRHRDDDRAGSRPSARSGLPHDALRNLVANAVTYAPTRTRYVDAARIGARTEIAVSDEGPACPKRLHPCSSALPGRQVARLILGTGLGLAIVKHLVELYGGTAARKPSRRRRQVYHQPAG